MTPAERVVRLGEASFRVADGKDGFWDRYEAGQWEPETLPSSILKSLLAPRPRKLSPGLSWISQACGVPGLMTSRGMVLVG